MTLYSPNSRERITVRLFDWRGRARKQAARRMRHFLRCLRTKHTHGISFALLARVYRVYKAFGRRTLWVYSGYRHPSVARLKHSYHTRGQAMDFRIPGVSRRRLRDYLLRTFKRAGVGYYPNSLFVHFDVRKKRMFWVDTSGPGEDSRYVNAQSVLRLEHLAKRSAKGRRLLAHLTRHVLPRASKAKAKPETKTKAEAKAETKPNATKPKLADQATEHHEPIVQGPSPVGPAPSIAQPHAPI